MPYLVTFLEGLITFLSPCLLPMLPIYLSYFAGGPASVFRQKTVQIVQDSTHFGRPAVLSRGRWGRGGAGGLPRPVLHAPGVPPTSAP